MTNDNEPQRGWTPAEMGRKGGRSRSERKVQAVQHNVSIARAARKLAPCSCDMEQRTGRFKGQHRSGCPVYKREQRAKDRTERQG